MKLYDGGSDKDDLLISETGNSAPSPVTSLGNQMFIMFTTNGNEGGKGFTAKITFGNIIITQNYLPIHVFRDQEFSMNWKFVNWKYKVAQLLLHNFNTLNWEGLLNKSMN